MKHELFVEVKPKVKARPRMTKSGRTYTPKGTLDYEKIIRDAWDGPWFEGMVDMEIDVHPNGVWIVVSDSQLIRPKGVTGDIDNYAKAVADALQGEGGAMPDDKQMMGLTTRFVHETFPV